MRITTLGATLLFVALAGAPALAARLHPGDQVDVLVYNHPELSGTRTLDAGGSISLPLAGTVQAAGLEPDALAKLVQGRLATYVRYAAVDVRLAAQTSSIFVDGGPVGVLKYEPGETLTNAVEQLATQPNQQMAGGAQIAASDPSATVNSTSLDLTNGPENFHAVRLDRDGEITSYDVVALRAAGDPGPTLHPGDTILIGHKPIAVKVSGAVTKPVTAYLAPDEPLSQALVQAGGITPTGSQDGIILRRDGSIQKISAGAPEFAEPGHDGDQLVVHRAPRVDVIGQVVKPGETYLRGDATLVSAIYYAGGPAEFANLKVVVLIHDGVRQGYDLTKLQHGASGENPIVADGDIVMVPKGSTFRVSDIWQAIGSLTFFGLHL
jgi:polysaccharide export outer membrane protein